jgi:hypothetical protein
MIEVVPQQEAWQRRSVSYLHSLLHHIKHGSSALFFSRSAVDNIVSPKQF